MLVREIEHAVNEEDVVDGQEKRMQEATVFQVSSTALHYVRALSIYNSDSKLKHLLDISVAEWANHILGDGLPSDEMLDCVDYVRGVWEAETVNPGFTDVVGDVAQISVDEAFHGKVLTKNDWKWILWP